MEGVVEIPLRRFEDERGWLSEIYRAGKLPKPIRRFLSLL